MRRNEEHMADFTFSTLKYERPDFKELELLFEDLVKQVQEAVSYEGLKELLKKAEHVQNKLMTACTIASIRHTLDTTDTYYEKEDEYINNTIPTVMPKFLAFDAAVMNSPFRDDIEKEYGKQYFAQKELNRKTFCEANIPLIRCLFPLACILHTFSAKMLYRLRLLNIGRVCTALVYHLLEQLRIL